LTNQSYRRAQFIIEVNAKKQATGDAREFPIHNRERMEQLTAPDMVAVVVPQLRQWVKGRKAEAIFGGLSQIDYETLTQSEKYALQEYWIQRYLELVIQKITERVKGNKDGSKNSVS
jgi:hypothetical protein